MFLTEDVNSKPLLKLTNNDFNNIFKSVKLAETGRRKDSRGKDLYFARYIFILKSNDFFTVEFLSEDKNYKKLHSIYSYDSKMKNPVTVYADGEKDISGFISLIKDKVNKNNMTEDSLSLNEGLLSSLKDLTGVVTSGIDIFLWVIWLGKKYVILRDQSYAETKAEIELNDFLFKGQKKEESAFKVYGNITTHIENVIKGDSKALILYGQPGTSKTYLVRRALHFSGLTPGKDYTIFSGTIADTDRSSLIIYETLWKNNGKLVVFDDFDNVLENESTTNLLKAALDSYPVRILSLPNTGSFFRQEIPSKFKYTGSMIIITNKTELDTALKSRATNIYINYSVEQFKDHIGKLLKFLNPYTTMDIKEEVFEFVSKEIAKDKGAIIDFRRFSSIVDLRITNPNEWKDLSMQILYPNEVK
jgi:hypothetical protein